MAKQIQTNSLDDRVLREILLEPIRRCMGYKPAFGQGSQDGFTLTQFQRLYGADPFYAWIGLDNGAVYAAHKAAGGLTSVYRQLGVGCERLVRFIFASCFTLNQEQMTWQYEYSKQNKSTGIHSLDVKVALTDLSGKSKDRLNSWLEEFRKSSSVKRPKLVGSVFEVRQGYKSADSKRQNADLRFGMHAYQESLLPVFLLMSAQISEPVANRYRADGMLVLIGSDENNPMISTFAFFREVVGFDLAEFFKRNSQELKREVDSIVKSLLTEV